MAIKSRLMQWHSLRLPRPVSGQFPLDSFWSIQSSDQIQAVFDPALHNLPTAAFLPSMSLNSVYTSGRNLVADGFYPLLLSNVHSAVPELPLDPVVFRSLLMCILASGGRNLLLRASDEDVALVQNITALVSACYPPTWTWL